MAAGRQPAREFHGVPLFIGGLQYSWRKGEDVAAQAIVAFFRRESDHEKIRAEISWNKRSGVVFFEGYGPWPFRAALRALDVTMRACGPGVAPRPRAQLEGCRTTYALPKLNLTTRATWPLSGLAPRQ